MTGFVFVIGWLACGYLGRGFVLAANRKAFADFVWTKQEAMASGRRLANAWVLLGPIGLFAGLLIAFIEGVVMKWEL